VAQAEGIHHSRPSLAVAADKVHEWADVLWVIFSVLNEASAVPRGDIIQIAQHKYFKVALVGPLKLLHKVGIQLCCSCSIVGRRDVAVNVDYPYLPRAGSTEGDRY
jgi:hypothetical protein